MKYSDNAMSAILLTSSLSIMPDSELKPLNLEEWNSFLEIMRAAGEEPGAILAYDFKGDELFSAHSGMWDRISELLERGGSVAFELEDLEKKGIDVVTSFDENYPILLKRRLQNEAPPIFFYAGNIDLAGKIGIAVVGSRNVDKKGSKFTRQLAEKAAKEKLVIYSGGAKGVDTIAEQTTINNDGAAVAYIADSLEGAIRNKDNLEALVNEKLLLLSDVRPDVGFSDNRAMNRNKYIYCSAYGAFVAASDYGEGGTWSGATEAIKHNWTNVYVWNNTDNKGNLGLIEQGAIPYELSEESLIETLSLKGTTKTQGSSEPSYKEESNSEEKTLSEEEKGMGQEIKTNLVDIDKFSEYLDKFVALVIKTQGEQDGKISFQGKFLQDEEGYKRELYDKAGLGVEYKESLINASDEDIVEKYLKVVDSSKNNFMHWLGDKVYIKKRLEEPESKKLLARIYKEEKENDEQLFNEATELWGQKYSLISFMFFLKDINDYAPVKPNILSEDLDYIGIDAQCLSRCTWTNYRTFIGILKEIQKLLHDSNKFVKVDLIDAHSFVWMVHIFNRSDKSETLTGEEERNKTIDKITGRNILYYGVPGSGKSFNINKIIDDDNGRERTERVVFHPEYTYSDFVGQILPVVVKKEGKKTNDISYEFVPGPFTKILKDAYHDKNHMYYLVIEEINRGNAPAIFGDIFQLLDRKYGKNDKGEEEYGESEYGITNTDIAKEVYGDKNQDQKVKIPANLTIYATMNTSDQNVFTLDTAFQRRWEMELVPNNFSVDNHDKDVIGGSSITWGDFATAINNKILSSNDALLSSEDKRLGVFFVTKEEVEDKYRFSRKVLKYLWDDAFKLNRSDAFKENLKSLEQVMKEFDNATGDPLKAVFKDDLYNEMAGQSKKETSEVSPETPKDVE